MNITKKDVTEMVMNEKGLWDNIHAKRERGEKPAKPGDKDYPKEKAWKAAQAEGETPGTDYKKDVQNSKEKAKAGVKQIGSTIGNAILNTFTKEGKDSFTNQNIFALIDEIVMMETGEPIIEDLEFTNKKLCEGIITSDILENIINEALYEYYSMTEDNLHEAEYHGKKVSLGKISRGDVKKYKVYVKNGQGHVVKVNFGDPHMEIKRDNPKRRKSFRARHHCENPGPRW
jgi:signal recognition particle GTPase